MVGAALCGPSMSLLLDVTDTDMEGLLYAFVHAREARQHEPEHRNQLTSELLFVGNAAAGLLESSPTRNA